MSDDATTPAPRIGRASEYGADPPDIPDPMPDELIEGARRERRAAEESEPGQAMEGESPTS